jgi:GMP synthase-like glutamine amidotransferase
MKPIAVFQHSPGTGPGHFIEYAARAGLPLHLYCGFLGEPLPASISGFSGLVSFGGPMSVNHRLGFIEQEARLMDEALRREIPVLGHCLGSQLLARALGATVEANRPAPWELGWFPVHAVESGHEEWTDAFNGQEVFHWHNENFTLPQGATHLLTNENCTHQAFACGPHLGMQFHIEITAAMIRDWCRRSDAPREWQHLPTVQSVETMQSDLQARVAQSNSIAERIYSRWSRSLYEKE